MSEIRYEQFTTWPTEQGPALRDLHALIFSNPDVSEASLKERLHWNHGPFVQLAWGQNESGSEQLVGYKIGYLRKENHFYSWLGGVDPKWRGHGIAGELMKQQHHWCREQGYKSVRTHTKNQWRSMLILNLRHDFDIIGTLTDEFGEAKLILEKKF